MESILKNTTSTTIFEDRYQLYIDTTMKIEARTYGTFVTEYDPLDNDLLLKKLPNLKEVTLKRDPTDGSKRYLHSINKTKKDQIQALRKVFNFDIHLSDKDDRTYLLDTPKLKIIEYSDKSLALFTSDISTLVKLREFDGKGAIKYNANLTGPGMVKGSGYLLFKSSKDYTKILETLSSDTFLSEDLPSKKSDDLPQRNTTENLAPGPKDQVRLRIYGDTKYVDAKLVEIQEDYGDNISILRDKKLPDDGRDLEIEISSE